MSNLLRRIVSSPQVRMQTSPSLAAPRSRARSFPLAILCLALLAVSASRAAQSDAAAQAAALRKRLVSILDSPEASGALWGIQVSSVASGDTIFKWNETKLFHPASAAKVFTTSAALVRLGPDFAYKTTLETSALVDANGTLNGSLIFVGRGDPNLSGRTLPYNGQKEISGKPTKVFAELAEQVRARGIRRIDGNLVIDDSYFVLEPYGQSWEIGDLVWNYGAPVSAIAVDDNVVTVTVHPAASVGAPALIRQEPLDAYYEVSNHVVTVAPPQRSSESAEPPEHLSVERRAGSHVLMLWGKILRNSSGWTELLAMDDPPRAAGELLRRELESRGIAIKGITAFQHREPFEVEDLAGSPNPPTLPGNTVVASHESLPLREGLKIINKNSENLHAEMLLRTLGRERRNVGSIEAGIEEVKKFAQEAGVLEKEFSLHDGSGLSRENLVSPSAMVTVLRYIYNSPYRAVWLDSLPVAGRDGTLANRLRSTSIAGRVIAKTGTLADNVSLAGYLIRPNQTPLAFAIFMNHHHLTAGAATAMVDRVVEEIAKLQ